MFLTVALFGYAAADTRSRFSHGKVEKGERHIPTTWNACLYRTKRGLPKVKCRKAMKTLKCGVLNIHHGNRVPIAGHRRHRASELADKETMPVIVRDLDDDAATIIMVDSNLQRESLLPSERAFAYKMKLDAMKHQGERVDLTSSQVGTKLRADEILAQQAGSSRNQIQRYIRLTELIPELLDMVDEKKIALNPAYELSFLKKEEQVDLLDAMDSEQATPSLSQAQRLKKYSQEGHLTLDMMRVIMGEEKKSDLDRVTFTSDTLRKYFPKSYTPQRMQETIIKLLEAWQKKRQRDQER